MNQLVRFALLAAVVSSTGCFSRYIISVDDSSAGDGPTSSILSTVDHQNNVIFRTTKFVFWECAERGGNLVCEKVCDIEDDQGEILMCQKQTRFF